jgi:hypothetical protein
LFVCDSLEDSVFSNTGFVFGGVAVLFGGLSNPALTSASFAARILLAKSFATLNLAFLIYASLICGGCFLPATFAFCISNCSFAFLLLITLLTICASESISTNSLIASTEKHSVIFFFFAAFLFLASSFRFKRLASSAAGTTSVICFLKL